ncbi:MAG: methyltransferase domain-containing protein [Gammaproteobacteria bacterium]|nr:methyltransferase domain-containing protein [Gammaproteobacteria bacterium]
MWDERYNDDDYVYGTTPNSFLASVIDRIQHKHTHVHPCKVLSLGEGEGRNAVFLAEHGCIVTAVDSSRVGLSKAEKLAKARGVVLKILHSDLAHLEIETAGWDAIVSIFCHVPSQLRKALHRKVVAGLRPGGVFVLEAYTPSQLALKTGGPQDADMTMTLAQLEKELDGLVFEHAQELEREVVEGKLHTGLGAVVQIIARKP